MNNDLVCDEVSCDEWNDLDLVVGKIKYGSKSVVCACIYRPPNPNDHVYNQKLSQAIGQIEQINANQYLIYGDFN